MEQSFRHEAVFYRGEAEFLATTVPFIRDGVENGEPVLAALAAEKVALLERELGDHADPVEFVEMAPLGRNPARIIPVWRDFAARSESEGRNVRGIGEPAWPGRAAAELTECDHHESLLNRAFADAAGFTLLCPYDADGLGAEVLDAARRNHPIVIEGGESLPSDCYLAPERAPSPLEAALPAPPGEPLELNFEIEDLANVRRFVSELAGHAGLDRAREADLVLAVSELAANSIRHGSGGGTIRAWQDTGALWCEVEDGGRFDDPLLGRIRPEPTQDYGRGLWLVHQLCDLVQLRSGPDGTIARVNVVLS